MDNDRGVNPESEAPVSDPLEGKPVTDALDEMISGSQRASVSTKKDGNPNATTSFLDEKASVISEEKPAPMDSIEITFTNIEGMDNGLFNENFCFSMEELQGSVEPVNGSTENHYHVFADSHYSHHLETGVDKQNTDIEQAGPQREDVTVAEQQVQVDTLKNSDGEIVLVGTKTDNEVMYGEETAIASNDEALNSQTILNGAAEEYQQLKDKEGLGQTAASDSETNSNFGQGMVTERHMGDVKQISLQDGQEMEIEKQEADTEQLKMTGTEQVSLHDGQEMEVDEDTNSIQPNTTEEKSAEQYQQVKVKEGLGQSAAQEYSGTDSNVGQGMAIEGHTVVEQVRLQERQEMEIEEQETNTEQPKMTNPDHVGLHDWHDLKVEEQDTDTAQPDATEKKYFEQAGLEPGTSVKADQPRYQLPPDAETEFSVSDLVWGKVKSHPWWPGQIFDPSDASEIAMKYHKKDCFLVAYFGDRTFAWNEASLLKPFGSHFSQVEKQSNSEAFHNAVDCALEEVSRRVELGLSCLCIPKDTLDEIKFQLVENTGIQQTSSKRDHLDKSAGAELFEPDKFLGYLKSLARSPCSGADRLELVIAKSQLLAFYRLNGYPLLPEFQFCGELLEDPNMLEFMDGMTEHESPDHQDDEVIQSGQEVLQTQRRPYNKRKHNLKDSSYPIKKEKALSELMVGSWDSEDNFNECDGNANIQLSSPSYGKNVKGSDSLADDLATADARKTISLAKVSTSTPSVPKPSFKIGDCIRRVASQMTGSPSILKSGSQKVEGNSDGLVWDGSDVSFQHSQDGEMKRMVVSTEYSSLDELLSQLHMAALDPLKGYSPLNTIISFFSDFRNSVTIDQPDKVGGKRRKTHSISGSPETFEFEDMSDTYWTDRVIRNGSEEPVSHKIRKLNCVPVELVPVRKSNSRKKYADGSDDLLANKPVGYVDEKAPAELVMHFPVVDSVPSEMILNKMFRRFGPLKEAQTEIDKDTNRARVVFRRCSDAEAAFGSAPKFNIFGSMLVNYHLNYTISVPFKTLPIATTHGEEDEALFLQY